jgi:hypothetical protein
MGIAQAFRRPMNPVRIVGWLMFHRRLEHEGHSPSITLERLCTSRHLGDLQWIASIVIAVVVVVIIDDALPQVKAIPHVAVGGAFVALAAGALNWIYQTGSRRMGSVDLFACEISVLSRVFMVANFARSSTERAQALMEAAKTPGPAPSPGAAAESIPPKFSSEEHYTPVYDDHLSELVPLNVDVITNVTEFYTYRKTMADYLRAMASASTLEELATFSRRVVYMEFLMYEAARKSISALVEFEPAKSEAIVNILCSELTAYAFLYSYYDDDDFRGQRLRLRRDDYRRIVDVILQRIEKNKHEACWERALTTANELRIRYREMAEATGLEASPSPSAPPLAKAA